MVCWWCGLLNGKRSFNGRSAANGEISLEECRDGLRSQIDEEVASWFNLARLEMLSEFGQETVMRTLLEQILTANYQGET